MSEQTEINYTLKNPFKYAFKGDSRTAEFITLTPPTMKQHSQAAALKQSIVRIVTDAVRANEDKDTDDKDTDDTITSEMIVGTIYGSASINATVVWGQARALLKERVAMVDGEQKLTSELMDKMSPTDFETMVGEYIANFTLA